MITVLNLARKISGSSPQQMLRFPRVVVLMITLLIIAPSALGQDKPMKTVGVEGNLAFYNYIKVRVENLQEWIKNPENDYRKFRLYIDGTEVPGLEPQLVDNNSKLLFDIERDPDNKAAWTTVLSRRPKGWTRNVVVTVGLEKSFPIPSDQVAPLTVINKVGFWVFFFSFLAAIALFSWLAVVSDILRDTGPQPEGNRLDGKPNRKPFSLARTQMAAWFFVVVISYVFIWMVTTDVSSLTTSVLALIGISAATGLGAAVVDSSKQTNLSNQKRVVEEKKKSAQVEFDSLQSEINTLTSAANAQPAPANLNDLKTELAAKQAAAQAKQTEIDQANLELTKIDTALRPNASKDFFRDILSDDDGVSFHRFQIFAWTIVFILIFVFSVYNVLAMPDFDTTLLALMGISGGTYVGFKLPNQEG